MNDVYKKDGEKLLIFYPSGKLNIESAIEFENNVQKAIHDNPHCHVLINLMDVNYISSSGLRVLLTMKQILNEKGNELKIFNANDICKRVFGINYFDHLVPIYDSENEAIHSFSE
jgi:anti-anti-sigma factor